ncbi:MAG: hypothetical protein LBT95_00305, partial [Treponema sp.]|nr:hypothetical protein [Treponema sp.]
MKGPLLIVPSLERGRGGGHLVRSLALLRGLRGEGREAFLYIPPGAPFGGEGGGDSAWYIRREEETVGQAWDFIILDRFRTPHKEFEAWAARGPLIGIDEGGSRRNRFDFLIDLLPGPPGFSGANIFAPCLLPLPKNRRPSFLPARDLVPEDGKTQGGRPLKILVSFGMEDPAGLTLPVVQALTFGKKYSGKEPPAPFPAEITVLAGNDKTATSSLPKAPGLRAFETIRELREHLAEYDLLITHFGLTAFEALHARLPVILLSPGRYHENLARRTFPVSAGRGKGRAAEISRRIYRKDPREGHFSGINFEFLKTLGEQCERAVRELDRLQAAEGTAAPQTLGELITAFTPLVPLSCPACGRGGRTNHRVLARFPRRTYRQCPRCGMVYMLRTDPPPIEYETD